MSLCWATLPTHGGLVDETWRGAEVRLGRLEAGRREDQAAQSGTRRDVDALRHTVGGLVERVGRVEAVAERADRKASEAREADVALTAAAQQLRSDIPGIVQRTLRDELAKRPASGGWGQMSVAQGATLLTAMGGIMGTIMAAVPAIIAAYRGTPIPAPLTTPPAIHAPAPAEDP